MDGNQISNVFIIHLFATLACSVIQHYDGTGEYKLKFLYFLTFDILLSQHDNNAVHLFASSDSILNYCTRVQSLFIHFQK